MAPKLGNRIIRAVNSALLARDRAEMRAVNALLTTIEPPRRRRAKTGRRHSTRHPR
jgi:hypothetical protein